MLLPLHFLTKETLCLSHMRERKYIFTRKRHYVNNIGTNTPTFSHKKNTLCSLHTLEHNYIFRLKKYFINDCRGINMLIFSHKRDTFFVTEAQTQLTKLVTRDCELFEFLLPCSQHKAHPFGHKGISFLLPSIAVGQRVYLMLEREHLLGQ